MTEQRALEILYATLRCKDMQANHDCELKDCTHCSVNDYQGTNDDYLEMLHIVFPVMYRYVNMKGENDNVR